MNQSRMEYCELWNYCRWGKSFNNKSMAMLYNYENKDIFFENNGKIFNYAITDHNKQLFKCLLQCFFRIMSYSRIDSFEYKKNIYVMTENMKENRDYLDSGEKYYKWYKNYRHAYENNLICDGDDDNVYEDENEDKFEDVDEDEDKFEDVDEDDDKNDDIRTILEYKEKHEKYLNTKTYIDVTYIE